MSLEVLRRRAAWGLVTAGALLLGGCAAETHATKTDGGVQAGASAQAGTASISVSASAGDTTAAKVNVEGPLPDATAKIESRSNSQVTGTVHFFQLPGDKTRVTVKLSGLTPGKHGIHLHEKGDCSAPDASSAGGHWNPAGVNHGGPMDAVHHAGDFGNLEADPDGNASLTLESSDFQLTGDKSVIGHAIIIHEKADDFVTQPTGNSGGRIGCGVVQKGM